MLLAWTGRLNHPYPEDGNYTIHTDSPAIFRILPTAPPFHSDQLVRLDGAELPKAANAVLW